MAIGRSVSPPSPPDPPPQPTNKWQKKPKKTKQLLLFKEFSTLFPKESGDLADLPYIRTDARSIIMVDNISNVSQSRTSQADSAQRSGGTKQPQTTNEKALVDGARQTVDVELSSAVRQAEEKALFDAEKVNAIKAAIENGSYPLDSRKIAENFLELERLI